MTRLRSPSIERINLERLYESEGLSMMEIANLLGCSHHKVDYWMRTYGVKRRSISDAVYRKNHPSGDPFVIKAKLTKTETKLLGIGIGLYWGEGNKANKTAVRLGNTDAALLKVFMRFLTELFGVKRADLRFGLQVFSDIDVEEALSYWKAALGVAKSQFYKPTVTISGSIGTYKTKSQHGVVTIYYHNRKLRDILVEMLPR